MDNSVEKVDNYAFYSDFNIKKVKLSTLRTFIFRNQNNYMQYIQHIEVNIFCRIVHNSFIFTIAENRKAEINAY